MDAFCWVKRDSYLPQGSQGLKAVTRYKVCVGVVCVCACMYVCVCLVFVCVGCGVCVCVCGYQSVVWPKSTSLPPVGVATTICRVRTGCM